MWMLRGSHEATKVLSATSKRVEWIRTSIIKALLVLRTAAGTQRQRSAKVGVSPAPRAILYVSGTIPLASSHLPSLRDVDPLRPKAVGTGPQSPEQCDWCLSKPSVIRSIHAAAIFTGIVSDAQRALSDCESHAKVHYATPSIGNPKPQPSKFMKPIMKLKLMPRIV